MAPRTPRRLVPTPADEGRTYGDQTDPEEGMARVHTDALLRYAEALLALITRIDAEIGTTNRDEADAWHELARYAYSLGDTAYTLYHAGYKDAALIQQRRGTAADAAAAPELTR